MLRRNSRRVAGVVAAGLAGAMVAIAQYATFTVSGTVADSLTGKPVAHAHVFLRANYGAEASAWGVLTDARGRFTISPVPAGQYALLAEHAGYLTADRNGGPHSVRVVLSANDRGQPYQLELTPGGGISGRVLTEEGKPVEDCQVVLDNPGGLSGSAPCEDKGYFRIGGLAGGRYHLVANPPSLAFPEEIRTDGSHEVHLGRTWYPSSQDRRSAGEVVLKTGQEVTGIEIRMRQAPFVTVSGKVSGVPAGQRAAVQLWPAGLSGSLQSVPAAESDGAFRIFRVEPGRHLLFADMQGGGAFAGTRSAPTMMDVTGVDPAQQELRLIAPFDVAGQVRFDGERAHLNALDASTPMVILEPVDSFLAPPLGTTFRGTIDAHDSFTLSKVSAGRYRLIVTLGSYVKSTRIGSKDSDGDILDLRNPPQGPVTLLVSSARCELSGLVTDNRIPVPGAGVILIREWDPTGPITLVAADRGGAYHFRNLPAGKYRALAMDNDAAWQLQRSKRVDDYISAAESIELRGGKSVVRNLTWH